jgi:hypothetical protein
MIWMMFTPNTGDDFRRKALLLNLSAFLDLTIICFYFGFLMLVIVLRIVLQGCFLALTSICMCFWTSPRHGWKTFMRVLFGIQE